jgi:hypothetical protein
LGSLPMGQECDPDERRTTWWTIWRKVKYLEHREHWKTLAWTDYFCVIQLGKPIYKP